jgi:hypothetical protein
MKALFIPVYSNIDGIKKLYDCIDYDIDLVHIISKPNITLNNNSHVKNLKITPYSYKFKSLAQIWNYFIESCDIDDYVIMNDDISFGAGYLENYFEVIKNNPNTYRIQAGYPHTCFSTSRYVIDKVGLYDENFIGAYYEDTDYHKRCIEANIEIIEVEGNLFNFQHEGRGTNKTCTDEERKIIKYNMERNMEYFNKKWNGYLIDTVKYSKPFNID